MTNLKMKNQNSNLESMRHSAAHLLAAAVKRLWPDTKFGIGPAIKDGFYYDFEFKKPISEKDLPKIEKEMKKIKAQNPKFEHYTLSIDQALEKEQKRNQTYKLKLLEELKEKGKKEASYYKLGDFDDLCSGPHVDSAEKIGELKLLRIAGAYWKGDEKKPMLTRIYGTVWNTKTELANYLTNRKEAEKRDHKKIGQKQELFFFHKTAPGMAYWLPKGLKVFNLLIDFWRKEHAKRGYVEFSAPLVNEKSLWETSGHWKYYREDMFVIPADKQTTYALKPMNCPNAMVVFASKTRSWRDLPLRLSDVDILHRNERSGTLNGLLRTAKFQQDDAHIFLTPNQIENEYKEIFKIVEKFYKIFGLEYSFRLGTRPEKSMGKADEWEKAEQTLTKILKQSNIPYKIGEGEGAFYGPKIDILAKDALGREWQMGTIQLDFQLPQRFRLKYTDKDGLQKTPVVIHRVIYGSLERFIAILLEHYNGALPVWLAPVQAIVLPITEKQAKWAQAVYSQIKKVGIRVEINTESMSLPAKVRKAQMQKIPYMIIVGQKEQENQSISLRMRDGKVVQTLTVEEFVKRVKEKVAKKSNKL